MAGYRRGGGRRLALALALGLAVPAAWAQVPDETPAAPAEAERVVTRAEIIHRPSPEEFDSAFPRRALADGVSGKAQLDCAIIVETRRTADCKVLSEEPAGYGFGEAAVTVAGFIRVKPPTVDGVPLRSARITLPVSFRVAPPQQAARTPPPPLAARPAPEPPLVAPAPEGTAPSAEPEPETREQRLARIGPLRRSQGALWLPAAFAVAVALGVGWALAWPLKPRRRRRPADQFA